MPGGWLSFEGRYIDVTIKRWQAYTGQDVVLEETGETLDEVAARRTGGAA